MYTGVVVRSIVEPLELSLSTVMLYCPAVLGLVIVPVGMSKPYSVVLFKLAEVRPETTIVLEAAVAAAVSVPGGAVILAGVFGKPLVLTVGVPVAIVKPEGKVTVILATLVGVVFSLNVTNRSLLVLALMLRRPSRALA